MNSRESIERRLARARKFAADPHLQAIALEHLKDNPVEFVADWCWTYDPRLIDPYIPFDLFPKQEDAVRFLWEIEHEGGVGVWEKSRDWGASYLAAAYLAHRFLFRPGFAGGVGSRKLEYVDQLGDPKSLFWKVRFVLDWLPRWMLPKEWILKRSSYDREARMENPANGATIMGEGGDQIGRGARTSLYLVDEMAFVERADSVDTALIATADAIAYISTPNGPGNTFARKAANPNVKKFTGHWKDDPRKADYEVRDETGAVIEAGNGYPALAGLTTYPWRERKLETYTVEQFAQEYDIDYAASIENLVIPYVWARAAVGVKLPGTVRDVPKRAGLDIAAGGTATNALVLCEGPIVTIAEEWKEKGDPITGQDRDNPVRAVYTAAAKIGRRQLAFLAVDRPGVGEGAPFAFSRVPNREFLRAKSINTGVAASETRYGEMSGRELYENLKSEMWMRLRERFRKTYEYVFEGIIYDASELISLPEGGATDKLIGEICNLKYFRTGRGKIRIETKDELQKRQVASPNLGDALALTELPEMSMKSSTGTAVANAVVEESAPSKPIAIRK